MSETTIATLPTVTARACRWAAPCPVRIDDKPCRGWLKSPQGNVSWKTRDFRGQGEGAPSTCDTCGAQALVSKGA